MKILFDVNHAAHVHFMYHAHQILTKQGHQCLVAASDKPLAYKLLDEKNVQYYPMGSIGISLIAKLWKLIVHDIKLLYYCIKHRPDIIMGIVAIRGSHVGWLLGIKTVVFTDTEHAKLQIAFFRPFANEIHTPEWFTKDLGKKQRKYKGFHELAYLHPHNFSPRVEVLEMLGVTADQPYFILRFVSWDATHDINQSGISHAGKQAIIEILEAHGKVFITSEYELEQEFKHLEYNLPSDYLHDALYYSSMVIGEGATTACEAALLGVPSIYINTISLGYIDYLQDSYDLLYHLTDIEEIKSQIKSLLSNPNLQSDWQKKKENFLSSQIDTTQYILSIIEESST